MNESVKLKWIADRERYPSKPWLKECSIIPIYWMRHGQSVDLMPDGLRKKIHLKLYWFIFHIIEITFGISISKDVKVGGGLRIYHFGNIFVNPNAVIGDNCTLRQGVTIGDRYNDGKAPIIADNVELGAYAQLIGDIKVGDSVKVGAMSLVLDSIPEHATACGVPAKVIKRN